MEILVHWMKFQVLTTEVTDLGINQSKLDHYSHLFRTTREGNIFSSNSFGLEHLNSAQRDQLNRLFHAFTGLVNGSAAEHWLVSNSGFSPYCSGPSSFPMEGTPFYCHWSCWKSWPGSCWGRGGKATSSQDRGTPPPGERVNAATPRAVSSTNLVYQDIHLLIT